ncbi:MAG: carbamoyltransferase [Candidatus Pacearchaeota archaeon]
MYILGISCYYHDSSAALIKDGKLIVAIQEERITRIKHDNSFPINSIKYCLESQNIQIGEIDYIAYYEKPFLKFERIIYQHLETFPKSYKLFITTMPKILSEKIRIEKIIRKKLKFKKDIFFIDHHLSHSASFLISPFKKAAILNLDGVGEWNTTTYGIGEENKIELIKKINFPHSLGLFYSTITAYLGFSVNNSEYKVMGLSAYGDRNIKTNRYYKRFKKIIDIKEDGSYRLDLDYFSYIHSSKMPSKKMCELLEGPVRKPNEQIKKRHKDIAAALQLILEEIIIKILNYLYNETKIKYVVISGGIGLNSLINGKILKKTPFQKIWISPDPGDGGSSIGAAFYLYNTLLNNKRVFKFNNIYLGPKYSSKEIKDFLEENKIRYMHFKKEEALINKTIELILKNKIIGWFQGKMEWGPRALGARSILSNPCNPSAKRLLNLKVKHREKFRPFAPTILREEMKKYFICDKNMPIITNYMLIVYRIKDKWIKLIPSVVHIDKTGRPQTISKNQNKRYYKLIEKFKEATKIPLLINTSFNIRGEPIVCSPYDAYRCMMGTGIDYLIMDKYLVEKKSNLRDKWECFIDEKD